MKDESEVNSKKFGFLALSPVYSSTHTSMWRPSREEIEYTHDSSKKPNFPYQHKDISERPSRSEIEYRCARAKYKTNFIIVTMSLNMEVLSAIVFAFAYFVFLLLLFLCVLKPVSQRENGG